MVNDRRVISERHQKHRTAHPRNDHRSRGSQPHRKKLHCRPRTGGKNLFAAFSKELHSNHQAEESQKQRQLRHLRISPGHLAPDERHAAENQSDKKHRGLERKILKKITDHKGKADNSDPHSKQIRKQL